MTDHSRVCVFVTKCQSFDMTAVDTVRRSFNFKADLCVCYEYCTSTPLSTCGLDFFLHSNMKLTTLFCSFRLPKTFSTDEGHALLFTTNLHRECTTFTAFLPFQVLDAVHRIPITDQINSLFSSTLNISPSLQFSLIGHALTLQKCSR